LPVAAAAREFSDDLEGEPGYGRLRGRGRFRVGARVRVKG